MSRFVSHFGIPREFARAFALLAFTTFIYDTLDVATRLARQIFQDLFGWKDARGRITATLISLMIPLFCVSLKLQDAQGHLVPAWKVFWTIFGTSNQLLSGLTLMAISVWLVKTRRPWWISAIPMVFMLVMTTWSLCLMMRPMAMSLLSGVFSWDWIAVVALLLLGLAVLLLWEAMQVTRAELWKVSSK